GRRARGRDFFALDDFIPTNDRRQLSRGMGETFCEDGTWTIHDGGRRKRQASKEQSGRRRAKNPGMRGPCPGRQRGVCRVRSVLTQSGLTHGLAAGGRGGGEWPAEGAGEPSRQLR